MTEDDAKTKWCPHAHVDNTHHGGEHCIASECCAWRWNKKGDSDPDREGHCGLSGKEP